MLRKSGERMAIIGAHVPRAPLERLDMFVGDAFPSRGEVVQMALAWYLRQWQARGARGEA